MKFILNHSWVAYETVLCEHDNLEEVLQGDYYVLEALSYDSTGYKVDADSIDYPMTVKEVAARLGIKESQLRYEMTLDNHTWRGAQIIEHENRLYFKRSDIERIASQSGVN